MKAEHFINEYAAALASHDWSSVAPLIHEDAAVTFSDGSVHRGKAAVQRAFERNFTVIADEDYSIDDVHWLLKSADFAVFQFRFKWTGVVDGKRVDASGIGTSVLKNEAGRWLLLAEHLGKDGNTGSALS